MVESAVMIGQCTALLACGKMGGLWCCLVRLGLRPSSLECVVREWSTARRDEVVGDLRGELGGIFSLPCRLRTVFPK